MPSIIYMNLLKLFQAMEERRLCGPPTLGTSMGRSSCQYWLRERGPLRPIIEGLVSRYEQAAVNVFDRDCCGRATEHKYFQQWPDISIR